MFKRVKLPSAGTVIATVALIAAMGGAAYAGGGVGNAVGTGELKRGAVTAPKLHTNAVRTRKIANNAVTAPKLHTNAVRTRKIANDAVTGVKARESTFGPVPSANKALNVLGAVVRADGTLLRAAQGNTSSTRTGAGTYIVDFEVDISACVYAATLGGAGTEPSGEVSTSTSTVDSVEVQTRSSNGDSADRGFSIVVVC